MQSEIKNKARARQIINFKGIRLGEKGMPTDCDGLIEWHNQAYILFEIKYRNKDVPYGQKLAFVRMCDDAGFISPQSSSSPSMTLIIPTTNASSEPFTFKVSGIAATLFLKT